jgi:hypothetical protein
MSAPDDRCLLWQDGAVNDEFHPAFGRGLTVAVAVAAVITFVFIISSSGMRDALLTLPWLCLFVTCCWAVFWRPGVVVSDAGIRLVNVTRTIDVPWPALLEVETRYALTLRTSYGRFTAWAAPAPGAGSALRTSMRSRRTYDTTDPDDEPASSSMGDLEGTASGDAATMVRRRWDRLREAGHLDAPQLEFEAPPTHWHWETGLVVAGLAVVSVGTLFLG